MIRTSLIATVAALLTVTPVYTAAGMEMSRRLAAMGAPDFAARTVIEDDPRAPLVVLSTHRATSREGPARGADITDAYARVVVDRATGTATWQVWHELFSHRLQLQIATVSFTVGDTTHTTSPFRQERLIDRCPATDMPGQCVETVRIGFSLSEEQVRQLATSTPQSGRDPWIIIFQDQGGNSFSVGLSPAELAGLLQAYDAWRGVKGNAR